MKPTEHQIQTTIINYLKAKGWYVIRLNSGGVKAINHYGKQHILRLAEKGTPDLLAFRKYDRKINGVSLKLGLPELLFIEVKRPGNMPTLAQQLKMDELEEYGAMCIIATSIEDLQKEEI